MPGKVKVKIVSGRNLPVMDRSNDTTDAYVELKLGNTTHKTDVCRKSLNPQWNSEWFRFEMDDLELQDEPLQIRLMDHDTYSANDAIGKVYLDLNPLLNSSTKTKESSSKMISGWFPVYDTMHGIRGEVNVIVRVEFFSDLNKFRQSSCGVRFFFTQSVPETFVAVAIHGFVEELVVNDDPEYQWIDKIRTPRASNEARQTLFSKLSGEVQRRVGLKALELGGNAVIGYRQCFDLEGESGIVVRGIGTAVTLTKQFDSQLSPTYMDAGMSRECGAGIGVDDHRYMMRMSCNGSGRSLKKKNRSARPHRRSFKAAVSAPDDDDDEEVVTNHHLLIRGKCGLEGSSLSRCKPNRSASFREDSLSSMRNRLSKRRPLPSSTMATSTSSLSPSKICSVTGPSALCPSLPFLPANESRSCNTCSDDVPGALSQVLGEPTTTTSSNSFRSDNGQLEWNKIIALNRTVRSIRNRYFSGGHGHKSKVSDGTDKMSTSLETSRSEGVGPTPDGHPHGTGRQCQSASDLGRLVRSKDSQSPLRIVNPKHIVRQESQNAQDQETGSTSNAGEEEDTTSDNGSKSNPFHGHETEIESSDVGVGGKDDLDSVMGVPNTPDSGRRKKASSSFQLLKRKRGSRKKDRYSKTSLMKRASETFSEKSLIVESTDWIKGEIVKLFKRKKSSDETESCSDATRGNSTKSKQSVYREPRFFFRRRRTMTGSTSSTVVSTGSAKLERSTSESHSLGQTSLDSLQSVQSVGSEPVFDDELAVIADESCENLDPLTIVSDQSQKCVLVTQMLPAPVHGTVPKVADVSDEVICPISALPTSTTKFYLGNESLTDEMNADRLDNSEVFNALKVIQELGYKNNDSSHKLYISSMDALFVCEDTKEVVTSLIPGREMLVSNNTNSSMLSSVPSDVTADLTSSCCSRNMTDWSLSTDSCSFGLGGQRSRARLREAFFSPVTGSVEVEDVNFDGVCDSSCKDSGRRSPIPEEFIDKSSCSPSSDTPVVTNINSVATVTNDTSTTTSNPRQQSNSKGPTSFTVLPVSEKPATATAGVAIHESSATASVSFRNEVTHQVTVSQPSSSPPPSSKSQVNGADAIRVTPSSSIQTHPGTYMSRRSSESDLSTPPKTGASHGFFPSSHSKVLGCTPSIRPGLNVDHFDMLEYPFITISMFPPGFLYQIGGTVTARSVKLLERISNLEEPESRDSWWTELRMEIRSHARSIGCNCVIGYEEHTTICDDVCILSASGTAAVVASDTTDSGSSGTPKQLLPSGREDPGSFVTKGDRSTGRTDNSHPNGFKGNSSAKHRHDSDGPFDPSCSVLHIPCNTIPFPIKMSRCALCKKGKVPDVLLVTVEMPPGLRTSGRSCLIQAQVYRSKKDCKGEISAKEVSDSLPFLEYELHRRLIHKLRVKGMNAVFSLQVQLCLGDKMIVAIATGTAVFVTALPQPTVPIITANVRTDSQKVLQFQKVIQEAYDRNREYYDIKNILLPQTPSSTTAKSYQTNGRLPGSNPEEPNCEDEVMDDEIPDLELSSGSKDTYVLEVDDAEDIDIISVLIDPSPPDGFHINNLENLYGFDDFRVVSQQMFTQVWRCRIPAPTLRHFANAFERLLRSVSFKLRRLKPCVLSQMRFRVELPEQDEMQLSVTGIAIGLAPKSKITPGDIVIPQSPTPKGDDTEMQFTLEEVGNGNPGPDSSAALTWELLIKDTSSASNSSKPVSRASSSLHTLAARQPAATNGSAPCLTSGMSASALAGNSAPVNRACNSSHGPPLSISPTVTIAQNTNSLRFQPQHAHKQSMVKSPYSTSRSGKSSIEISPLSFLHGARIERYLGNLNFFFIRETSSIRESGGLSGFVHSFITEVLAIARAHVAALGGNAMVSYFMTELALLHNPHKNQGQCLINIGGDVVFASYLMGHEDHFHHGTPLQVLPS